MNTVYKRLTSIVKRDPTNRYLSAKKLQRYIEDGGGKDVLMSKKEVEELLPLAKEQGLAFVRVDADQGRQTECWAFASCNTNLMDHELCR